MRKWEEIGHFRFFDHLEEKTKRLEEIVAFNRTLNARHELDILLALLLDKAIEISRAERGFIVMGEKGRVALARNFDKEWIHEAGFKISRSLATYAFNTCKPFLTPNAQEETPIETSGSIKALGLRSVLCIPLCIKERSIGVVYLDNRFCNGAFCPDHLSSLQLLADQAALAIYQSRLLEELEKKEHEIGMLKKNRPSHAVPLEIEREREGIYRFGELISANFLMKQLFLMASRASQSDISVLIQGESGTGKSELAYAIHQASGRKGQKFIAENCAALTDTLLESELFGYKRGAFTGATENRIGLFEAANGGTLFLDEVGDMSPAMQSKLLKVLESGMVRPVGSQEWKKVDVRVICATHRDLSKMVEEKTFREDLWYRLKVLLLSIPPLRERPEDIPLLASHFLERQKEAKEKGIFEMDPLAMKCLMEYGWPGNVRHLEHEIRRIVALKGPHRKIAKEDLSPEITDGEEFLRIHSRLPLKEAVRRFEHNYVLQTIKDVGGNKKEAAKILGLSRRSIYNKFCPEEEGPSLALDSSIPPDPL